MRILGHKKADQSHYYIREANKSKIAQSGMRKWEAAEGISSVTTAEALALFRHHLQSSTTLPDSRTCSAQKRVAVLLTFTVYQFFQGLPIGKPYLTL